MRKSILAIVTSLEGLAKKAHVRTAKQKHRVNSSSNNSRISNNISFIFSRGLKLKLKLRPRLMPKSRPKFRLKLISNLRFLTVLQDLMTIISNHPPVKSTQLLRAF